MIKKKLITIVGARPQFIKAATFTRAINNYNKIQNKIKIEEIIIHTGQHFDTNMSDVFFEELEIPMPKYNLKISSGNHGEMTGKMIAEIENILLAEKPDFIILYGDTNSTLAGSIAGSKIKIPIIHIESGLRSFNPEMPEEINRILTDRLSSFLFCPTETAIINLKKEGYPYISNSNFGEQKIYNCGDIMYETILFYKKLAERKINLSKWNLEEKNYVLCTIHRAENTDDVNKLINITNALAQISIHIPVLLPLHPRTRKLIETYNIGLSNDIIITDPLSYLEIQRLQMSAKKIITDSGGIQKEAYFHKVPCITLRNETEWIETVDSKCNILVGSNKEKIVEEFNKNNTDANFELELYGSGKTTSYIIDKIIEDLI